MSGIVSLVKECLQHNNNHDIPSLQDGLFRLYRNFNIQGSGSLIINYPQKEELAECFLMMLMYDWENNSDIREVWAEDGFYCISMFLEENILKVSEQVVGGLDLFLILEEGGESLRTKFNDVLQKSSMHPVYCSIFSNKEYQGGADYLIREFKFFAATLLSPWEKKYNLISAEYRVPFDRAKTDFEFTDISPEIILGKIRFFAHIIGSILEEF